MRQEQGFQFPLIPFLPQASRRRRSIPGNGFQGFEQGSIHRSRSGQQSPLIVMATWIMPLHQSVQCHVAHTDIHGALSHRQVGHPSQIQKSGMPVEKPTFAERDQGSALSAQGHILVAKLSHQRNLKMIHHRFSISDLSRESMFGLMENGLTVAGHEIRLQGMLFNPIGHYFA